MKQSRAMSLLESLINIAVGLAVAMAANAIILPALGFPITLADNAIIAVFMTLVSICRSFALRRAFEALHIRRPLSPFMQAVIAERYRQIEAEGWSHAHDDKYPPGELALAGAAYVVGRCREGGTRAQPRPPDFWPWRRSWWKPVDLRRDFVKAAALIIADGERHDRGKTRRAA